VTGNQSILRGAQVRFGEGPQPGCEPSDSDSQSAITGRHVVLRAGVQSMSLYPSKKALLGCNFSE
jgi:hypothetical protein